MTARHTNLRTFFAFDLADSDEIRLEKFATFLLAGSCTLAGIMWSALYYFTFGWGLTAFLPASFVIIVGNALVISHLTKNHHYAIYAQIVCIIYITTFIQWSIGGVFDSGFVLVWAFLGPLCSLMFFSLRQSILWFALYLTNLVITVVFNDFFAGFSQGVPENTRVIFFIMNLSIASVVVFIFAGYYVAAAKRERAKAEKLLLNVLPKEIASRLKEENGTIAEGYDAISVLFADVVGFTPLSEIFTPHQSVEMLDEIFTFFDILADKYDLEKIRTIGDGYMVIGGAPRPKANHAHAVAQMALDMKAYMTNHTNGNYSLKIRIGVNSGPAVAGIIGTTKFHYDVWGDAVNTAARMESHGEPGKIQIGPGTYELIKDEFCCTPRGIVDVKGKGTMQTWFLEDVQP